MDFYSSIARYYEEIFPVDPDQKNLVLKEAGGMPGGRHLDVGCATGTLLSALKAGFGHVEGLDLNPRLLARAREIHPDLENVPLLEASMTDLAKLFPPAGFDSISCFGNTLVHLTQPQALRDFFCGCKSVLGPEGVLAVQIINYDRILAGSSRSLPTLETPVLRFERRYTGPDDRGLLSFDTTLILKDSLARLENSLPLHPMLQKDMDRLAREAGFSRRNFFGDFTSRPWAPDSFLTVGIFRP